MAAQPPSLRHHLPAKATRHHRRSLPRRHPLAGPHHPPRPHRRGEGAAGRRLRPTAIRGRRRRVRDDHQRPGRPDPWRYPHPQPRSRTTRRHHRRNRRHGDHPSQQPQTPHSQWPGLGTQRRHLDHHRRRDDGTLTIRKSGLRFGGSILSQPPTSPNTSTSATRSPPTAPKAPPPTPRTCSSNPPPSGKPSTSR